MAKYKRIRLRLKKARLDKQKAQQKQKLRVIKLSNLRDDGTGNWQLSQMHNQSSTILVTSGNKITFGWPRSQMTVYPGQTARIYTGWTIDQIPSKDCMETFPHQVLLEYNVLSIPRHIHSDQANGGQVVQVILNNSNKPLQVTLNQDDPQGQPMVGFLNQQGQFQTLMQDLQFPWNILITALLSFASTVVPLFLKKNEAIQSNKYGDPPEPSWQFVQTDPGASNVQMVNPLAPKFGWPKRQITAWPGQAIRMNLGWLNQSIPPGCGMKVYPNENLLNLNIISMPMYLHNLEAGQQVSVTLLNNNKNKILKITPDPLFPDSDPTFRLVNMDHKTEQNLTNWFTDIFSIFLKVQSFINPITRPDP